MAGILGFKPGLEHAMLTVYVVLPALQGQYFPFLWMVCHEDGDYGHIRTTINEKTIAGSTYQLF